MSTSESVAAVIKWHLETRNVRFVFPSAVAADFWARWTVESGTAKAVDRERFLAWDRFKAATLAVERNDRFPANAAARNMFCAALLAENAERAGQGKPSFREIVSPEHAGNWRAFVSSMSRMIPALAAFFRRPHSERLREAYYEDLRFIAARYSTFLDRNGLFEPAWDRSPFRAAGSRWVLLFPELAEDWQEYEAELAAESSVEIRRADSLGAPPRYTTVGATVGTSALHERLGAYSGGLVRFSSAIEEIRWIARFAADLIDRAAIDPSDIVVSVADIDNYIDRMALEFRLRDVPIDIRKGRPITDHPAGRLFGALAACRSTRWSFRALADLLLDTAYPWKQRGDIDALMDFGLRFRCVSGFPEKGIEIDVWERSFERLEIAEPEIGGSLRKPIRSIAAFYRKLKRDIRNVVEAPNFSELRNRLLQFKTNHFEVERMNAQTDNVFSRALEELADLAATERRLEGIRIGDPYGLFLTHLKGANYVFQAATPGVLVYDYRVAAGISALVHIIADATQNAISVRADPAPFLREDRKIQARIDERDISSDFIQAYDISGAFVIYTAAEHSFSGFSVPHRLLVTDRRPSGTTPDQLLEGAVDPIEYEADPCSSGATAGNVVAATTVQREARRKADTVSIRPGIDARRSPFVRPRTRQLITGRLCADTENRRISPTDLNDLASCSFSWLLRRGLGIREKETEIETVDAKELGSLYHRILERFFARAFSAAPRFRAENLDEYKKMLGEETDAALEERRLREGAFQESVYRMYRVRLYASLERFLETLAEDIDAAALEGTEKPLRLDYPEYGIALSGMADVVFRADSGDRIVYDFKMTHVPLTGSLLPDENGLLEDHQIAAYIRMLEAGSEPLVAEAAYYSIENREYKRVLSRREKSARSRLPISRTELEPIMRALDEAVQSASATVEESYFPVLPPGQRESCNSCKVSAVCRIPFAGGDR